MGTKFLIPFTDFGRIHQTIYSIAESEGGDRRRNCIFFSIVGADILRQHYGIQATVSAGVAAYRLGGGERQTLTFAEIVDGEVHSTPNGFHVWVEAKGWLLDFMSPLFSRIMDVPAKMLQKELSCGADKLSSLAKTGDFFLYPDFERAQSLLEQFSSKPVNRDLLQIASDWYRRPPRKMKKIQPIFTQDGDAKEVRLTGLLPSGVW